MDRADDLRVWEYAAQNGCTVVKRDSDYNDLSLLRGFPPKVIWIRRGNCSTKESEQLIRNLSKAIQSFGSDRSTGVLKLH